MTEDSSQRHEARPGNTDHPEVTSRSVRGPRLPGVRDAGDAWVEAPNGERYWGRFGAAGLLVHDPERGVLLQHRATWSHHGDTWGIPGGALHAGESAFDGACREAAEEGDVPRGSVDMIAAVVLDRGVWTYTTVVARVTAPFEARALDAESHELRWVPVDEVASLPLHPGFGSAWALHRRLLEAERLLVVDAANVVGARADGWWKDRAGATAKLLHEMDLLAEQGVDAQTWSSANGDAEDGSANIPVPEGLTVSLMPHVSLVIEGKVRDVVNPAMMQPTETPHARAVKDGATASGSSGDALEAQAGAPSGQLTAPPEQAGHRKARVEVVRAQASGDDAVVAVVRSVLTPASSEVQRVADADVVVVTSDRELQQRARDAGARAVGARWLLHLVDGVSRSTVGQKAHAHGLSDPESTDPE